MAYCLDSPASRVPLPASPKRALGIRSTSSVSDSHAPALVTVPGPSPFSCPQCKEHISFSEIDAAFHDMQRYDLLADRSYRAALEKRPMNVKLLRAYARFIEEVLKDPFRAHHVRGEAEKRERAAEAKTRRTSAQHGAVDERVDAVVVATAAGTIKMANKNLHRLFGCAPSACRNWIHHVSRRPAE